MALICQCVFATADNGKLKYVKECLASLVYSVDLKKHRLIVIDNASFLDARVFLNAFCDAYPELNISIIHLPENVGTARGINIGLAHRTDGELCIKCDDDVTWQTNGWVDELETAIAQKPDIGILGLKRKDIWQHPNHENPAFRTVMEGIFEICPDIMGTCTAYNPAMLEKVGRLIQISNRYGYDDSIYSVRSEAAGFRNAFLPHIAITHIDEGGTDYTDWKIKEGETYLQEALALMNSIRSGETSYFFDWE
jgi:GT2 family glycosyltransferase